jgi:flagellar hook-associated protein 1 FlgK
MAASLTINPLATANPTLVRDGGFNGPGYSSNTSGSSGYTDLLDSFATALGENMAFDTTTGLDGTSSIMDFASSSIGWLEELRSAASTANDNKTALLSRTQDALSNVTGVSLDEELSQLLDLEQSYKASAKLVSTVDAMMTALLQAVG